MFDDYMLQNFSFYINTPLFTLLFSIIIRFWNIYKNSTQNLSENQQEKFIKCIYIQDNDIDLSDTDIKIDDVNINDYIQEFKKTLKFPSSNQNEKNKYDQIIFEKIINEVIFFSLNIDFRKKQKKMMYCHRRLDESNMSDVIFYIFKDHSLFITLLMADCDKYLQKTKIESLENYKDLIYDDNYSKKDIEIIVNDKIDVFKNYIYKLIKKIDSKVSNYFYLFDRWIDVFESDEDKLKIEHYPKIRNKCEEITILEDICCIGDKELIKLIFPILNKMDFFQRKNILNKMSSGTKKKTDYLFYPSNNNDCIISLKNNENISENIKKDIHDTFDTLIKDVRSIDFENIKTKSQLDKKVQIIVEKTKKIILK